MAVYKRERSKFYWCKFMFRGQLVQQSTKCTNKSDARNYEAALKTQLNFAGLRIEDINATNDDITFADATKHFFEDLADVKESTRRRYVTAAKPLIAYFGKTPVHKIDQEHVIKYRKHRSSQKVAAPIKKLRKNKSAKTNKPIKPATINRECTLLAMIFRYLITVKKLRLAVPTYGLKQYKEDNITERIVTRSEFALYLRFASQPLRDVARLMFYTGMRPGEVLALTKHDVDFKSRKIIVRHGKTRSARRQIPLLPRPMQILRRRCDKTTNGLLFPGGKNEKAAVPMVKVNNAHNGALQRSGVDEFRLYDLRHSFATRAHAAGIDLETLRVLGGWANLAMLKRYVKPSLEHKANEMQKLDRRRGGIQSNVIPFDRRAA